MSVTVSWITIFQSSSRSQCFIVARSSIYNHHIPHLQMSPYTHKIKKNHQHPVFHYMPCCISKPSVTSRAHFPHVLKPVYTRQYRPKKECVTFRLKPADQMLGNVFLEADTSWQWMLVLNFKLPPISLYL